MRKNYTSAFLFILTLFLGVVKTNAQTSLELGDIAFTSINIDDEKFSFVFLADIENGTTFYITDNSWNGSSLTSDEYEILFTSTAAIPRGEQISIAMETLAITFSSGITKGTVTSVGIHHTSIGNNLNSAGDNLFIHQGTQGNPGVSDFITGINLGLGIATTPGNAWQLTNSASNTLLPSTLTNGTNAIGLFPSTAFGSDLQNVGYKAASLHIGNKATLLAQLMNYTNWEGDNVTTYHPTDIFTVSATLNTDIHVLEKNISIYPNPTVDDITIRLPQDVSLEKATLISVSGATVKTTNISTVNISDIASGIYFLTIETNQGSITKKVVKK